jgi:hypothetical protein
MFYAPSEEALCQRDARIANTVVSATQCQQTKSALPPLWLPRILALTLPELRNESPVTRRKQVCNPLDNPLLLLSLVDEQIA